MFQASDPDRDFDEGGGEPFARPEPRRRSISSWRARDPARGFRFLPYVFTALATGVMLAALGIVASSPSAAAGAAGPASGEVASE